MATNRNPEEYPATRGRRHGGTPAEDTWHSVDGCPPELQGPDGASTVDRELQNVAAPIWRRSCRHETRVAISQKYRIRPTRRLRTNRAVARSHVLEPSRRWTRTAQSPFDRGRSQAHLCTEPPSYRRRGMLPRAKARGGGGGGGRGRPASSRLRALPPQCQVAVRFLRAVVLLSLLPRCCRRPRPSTAADKAYALHALRVRPESLGLVHWMWPVSCLLLLRNLQALERRPKQVHLPLRRLRPVQSWPGVGQGLFPLQGKHPNLFRPSLTAETDTNRNAWPASPSAATTNASSGRPTATAPSAATTCSTRPSPSSSCSAGTASTGTASRST